MGDSWGNFNDGRCVSLGIAAISPPVAEKRDTQCSVPETTLLPFLRHLPGRRQIQPLPELLFGGGAG